MGSGQSAVEIALDVYRRFEGTRVHLVTVPIDYSENKRVLVDELKARLPVVAPA